MSLEENIKLEDSYSKDLLEEVLKTCCLEKFVAKHRLDYIIDERSKNISGGEKQRIGLARILIRRPEILILDEITSSLNEDIKEKVVKRLKDFVEKYELTTIVVTHCREFDKYANKIIDI